MDECIHGCGLTIETCVLCRGKSDFYKSAGNPEGIVVAAPKPRALLPPKPVDWWIRQGMSAPMDPTEVLMAGLAAKTICPRCLTSRLPIGCECDREQVYRDGMADVSAFLHDQVERLGVKEREAPHIARSAQKRALRRVNLSEEDKDDERMGLFEEWEITPTWTPFKINEPTHLPV